MKKTLILLAALCFGLSAAQAQDDVRKATAEAAAAFSEAQAEAVEPAPSYWKKFATFDLGFNQTASGAGRPAAITAPPCAPASTPTSTTRKNSPAGPTACS